jgi:hypothetical protein
VEIGEEPGLEYDSASDDELQAVSSLGADFGVAPPLRFKLLHNLWCVPCSGFSSPPTWLAQCNPPT